MIVDWYGLTDFRDYPILHCNTTRLLETAERLKSKFVICYVMEGDWLHTKRDTEIGAPRQSAAQLAERLRRFAAREDVPMLNCEIYQEGTLSPMTVEMLKSLHELQ